MSCCFMTNITMASIDRLSATKAIVSMNWSRMPAHKLGKLIFVFFTGVVLVSFLAVGSRFSELSIPTWHRNPWTLQQHTSFVRYTKNLISIYNDSLPTSPPRFLAGAISPEELKELDSSERPLEVATHHPRLFANPQR